MLPSYHMTDEYRDEYIVREEEEDRLNKEAQFEHEQLQAQADQEARSENSRENTNSGSSSSPTESMASSRGPFPEPPLASLVKRNSLSPSNDGANELYKFHEAMNVSQSSSGEDAGIKNKESSSLSGKKADLNPKISDNVENLRGPNLG